jgi:hypothetical protein
MSLRSRFEALLRQLLIATREKKLSWEETADENTFRLIFDGGMVNVTQRSAVVGVPLRTKYIATLLNEHNNLVEEFDPENEVEGALLSDVFHAARKSSVHPEEVFSSIERELQHRLQAGNR